MIELETYVGFGKDQDGPAALPDHRQHPLQRVLLGILNHNAGQCGQDLLPSELFVQGGRDAAGKLYCQEY